jgi:hypothetical protein
MAESTLTSYNYEDIGDSYEDILKHYKGRHCEYAKSKLVDFEKELKAAELVSSNANAFKRLATVEKHIRAIKQFLKSISSCSIMGGRSKRAKRTRRAKKSKRTRRNR